MRDTVKEFKQQMENDLAKTFSEKAFVKTTPDYSFTVNGQEITLRITNIPGADRYEVYQSESARGTYELVSAGMSPIQDFYTTSGKSCYYKVRALHGTGEGQLATLFSKPQFVDLVSAAKARDERIDRFFESIQGISDTLTFEDLDIAIEALKVAGLEIREKERRRRLEEEAEKNRQAIELQNKRRQAAAARAAARREKKRLEHVESITRMDLPMDFTNAFAGDERASEHCETMSEGLMMSLDLLGMVDIEFIASVTGSDLRTVIESLRGTIYQNPLHWNEVFYKGWETADEYLSGNLMHKYKVAKEANEQYNGYFQNNVTALEGLLEPDIPVEDIYVSLGSPWVPTDIIDEFITYMAFGNRLDSTEAKEYYSMASEADYAVRHDEYTGLWEIPKKTRFRMSQYHGMFEEVNYKIYGTNRMDMLYVLENTLNMKTLTITDAKDKDGKIRIINQAETVKVLEKQRFMIETFQNWIWTDEKRKKRLQAAYCRRYGNVRKRTFDGSFLEFPDMNPDVQLYDYQKNAVARIIFSPNTLLAHDVGAGKTYVMIAAGMELRRLGKSKKNLYVVPNNILAQWGNTFKMMYPEAHILLVNEKNFCPKKRSETLNQIKNDDFDAIIMPYSCFDMLSLSDRYYLKLNQERLKKLDAAIKAYANGTPVDKMRQKVQKTIEKLQKTYKQTPKVMPFDELGINTLFVDEAHNYKNINLGSRIAMVRGMNNEGSTRGNGMMDKVHCVQRMNDGGRVVFATGTPVTNSLSDIFVMQKYLQEGELEFQGILNYDAWAGMYAEKVTDYEIDVDTNSYRLVTRFARFCNLPELTATLSTIIDFHKVDKEAGIPELEGYTDSLRDGSQDFKDYLRDISNRADDIHKKRVKQDVDNMLKVTTDGRKAALDMRLIDTAFGLDPDSKVMRCAENVMAVYQETRDIKGTQLVFCDISTPKNRFNLYDDLKSLLVAMGMPKEEIAFIHDAASDVKRQELFKKVRAGEVAVLVGSTAKLGHGVNVQKRLAAIHHLDVPWRPSDMVQREGRILRQGNDNESVRIFRYITKASFDAYSWQLLETKQRFIGQIMSGETMMREGTDIDDTVLNYAEVKALAVGNMKIKRRVEVCNELDKYRILQRDYMEERRKKEQLLVTMPEKIRHQKERILNCQKDIEVYDAEKVDYKAMGYKEQKAIREAIMNAVKANQNNVEDTFVLKFQGFDVIVPRLMVPMMSGRKEEAKDSGEEVTELADSRQLIYYVHLVRNNSYHLEIESESGITTRLNNFLEGLPKQKAKYEEVLKAMEYRLETAKAELADKTGGYVEEISVLKKELDELNEELGVV